MKGKTHLIIGVAIGTIAAMHHLPEQNNSLYYIGVAAFSALAADLDGPSILSSKLTKLSKFIRSFALWGSIIYFAIIAYMYFMSMHVPLLLAGGAIAALLIGLTMKQGIIRNALVSVIGLYCIYHGITNNQQWLVGLGIFIAWAPWLKHRGLTHTIWVIPMWGWIGWGLEQQLAINGLANTAMIGYLSHLIADTLTPSGVKWLFPIWKKSFKLKLW
ncbi:metal-dependent hydrolase [Paenibacillus yanchengensis]|uniref:Metal-dependent hydrolase n=1 Tax=Paenibacillus yanchengensis TaxID=2035833 RepID=A0ABW4YIX8_9BACL